MINIKIIIIESSIKQAMIIREILQDSRKKEFEIDIFENFENGLKALSTNDYDIVLLDMDIPDYQGLKSLDIVQTKAPQIPVIVLTEYDDENISIKAVRKGAQDYLIKSQMNEHALTKSIYYAVERKRAEEERERLQLQLRHAHKYQAVGTLVRGITHDFNNVLFPIMGYAEMALDGLKDTNINRQYIEKIIEAVTRARIRVQQLLTFSNPAEVEKKVIHIHHLVEETLKLVRSTLPSSIEIHQNIKECGCVDADSNKINQIVMNLCINAWQAMSNDRGIISVELYEKNFEYEICEDIELESKKYVVLTVKDNGQGMDSHVMERIFDPYFTTKTYEQSSGLGLSVVHGIVTSHEGKISVISEPGKGSEFKIFLPVVEYVNNIEPINNYADRSIQTGQERVLVVDDEELIVEMLEQMLQGLGYEVLGYMSVSEALKKFQMNPKYFDLVITDLTMPEMSGLDLAKELLLIRSDVPVILSTGFTDISLEDDNIKPYIKELIIKPLNIKELSEKIRKTLDNSKKISSESG